jgi:DNA-binding CsgD family transcriptional regulator
MTNCSVGEYTLTQAAGVLECENLVDDLRRALRFLKPREEQIVRLRFGLNDGVFRSLADVARCFNISRERVRQIERSSLRKIRMKRFLWKYSNGSIQRVQSFLHRLPPQQAKTVRSRMDKFDGTIKSLEQILAKEELVTDGHRGHRFNLIDGVYL